MPLEFLLQAGLTPTQAEILGFLLSVDIRKASELVVSLGLARGVVYKALDELIELDLVEKLEEPGAVARFRAEHPSRLEELFEAREKLAKKERQNFIATLPEISTQYNLNHHKPAITYHEGKVGLIQTLDRLAESQTEVLIFFDRNSIRPEDVFTDIHKEYEKKLLKFGTRQRVLIAGEESRHENGNTDNGSINEKTNNRIEIRYLDNPINPFKSSVAIHDYKLSYQIIEHRQTMTVTIEDRNIYELNKAMFEYLWQQGK